MHVSGLVLIVQPNIMVAHYAKQDTERISVKYISIKSSTGTPFRRSNPTNYQANHYNNFFWLFAHGFRIARLFICVPSLYTQTHNTSRRTIVDSASVQTNNRTYFVQTHAASCLVMRLAKVKYISFHLFVLRLSTLMKVSPLRLLERFRR